MEQNENNNGHLVTADELVMDEVTIIREQERLAQEKRKKASAKRKKVIFSILGVLVVLCIAFLVWGRKLIKKDTDTQVAIKTTDKQKVTYAKVDSINGNEISYTLLEEKAEDDATPFSGESKSSSTESATSSEGKSKSDGEASDGSGGFPGGGFNPGSMPSGGDFDPSSMPSGGDFDPSSMPGGGSGSFPGRGGFSDSKGERPSSGDSFGRKQNGRDSSTVLTYNGKNYMLSTETKTEYIPVGVVVTTKLGTETTFSRISSGDCLAIVTELVDGQDSIVAIYIVG